MPKRYLIPFALILMLLLAACGGQQTAEPGAAANQPANNAEESMESMPEEAGDDMEVMDEMAGEHDDDAAMEEAGAEESMDTMPEDSMDDMEGEHEEENLDAAMDESSMDSDEAMEIESGDEAMAAPAEEMMDLPTWQTLALTNAATGETFTLGDFQGKTVFVEPMATWCSNCRAQQGQVVEAKSQLGDDVVFIGLSLETGLPPADLAGYAQSNGFDWTYAVMSPELLSELVDAFGRSITSAPSTPHFIIRPDGSYTELATGIHSAEELIAEIQGAQS